MFTRGIELFKILGFSVKIDASWLIIALLVTWSLATGFFPAYYADLSSTAYWWMGISGALGLFVSIVLHEFGHAMAARRFGVEMRGITLFIFGGVAEMKDEPPSPQAEFVIAIAGPIVSVLIAAGCYALGIAADQVGMSISVLGVLSYLSSINLLLVAFNMIPAFPLDGGRVLRAILWKMKNSLRWATRVTSTIGSAFGIGLILLGVVSVFTGNFIGGMWWFLLGMFLRGAAQMSYQQLLVRRALEGEPIQRFMQSEVQTVPFDEPVSDFVENYVYRYHHKLFPVTNNGTLLGCMTTNKLRDLPREEWSHHTVGEVADTCSEENTIEASEDATAALAKMNQGNSRLIVVEDGKLKGIVGLRDMMKFIALKVELEDA
jgi:Zn-dependent protease/predicted transcriptional regulator